MWYVEYRVYQRYPILDMHLPKKETGFDYIPEEDGEEINVRLICVQFGLQYKELSECRYSEYLKWVARYKAYHFDSEQFHESHKKEEIR